MCTARLIAYSAQWQRLNGMPVGDDSVMHSSPFASRQARSFRAPRRAFLSARSRASSTIHRRRSSRGRAAPTAFASSLVHPLPDHADVRAGRVGGVVDRLDEEVPHLSAAGCSCSCSSGCSWFLTCENYTQGRSYRRRRRGAGESAQAHPRRHLPAAHPDRPRHGHPSRCEGGPHPGRRPRLPGELAEEVGEHREVDPGAGADAAPDEVDELGVREGRYRLLLDWFRDVGRSGRRRCRLARPARAPQWSVVGCY